MKTRGSPPKTLTGRGSVSSVDSPWWDRIASEVIPSMGLVGRTMTIEELTQTLPAYPNGGRPRAHAVSRRLRKVLELVDRGPNGSRSRGATYKILPPEMPPNVSGEIDAVMSDDDWIEASVRKMLGDDE